MTSVEHASGEGVGGDRSGVTRTAHEAYARVLENWCQTVADYEAALSGAADAPVKLNLGSSDVVLRGFINVDAVPAPGVLVADLTKPWPWADSSVDYVRASHIIEHLPDKIFTMNELWRVLKPGARADIAVPTTDGPGAWQDPTHVSFWNRRSFLYFEDGSPYRSWSARPYGIDARFRTVRARVDHTFDGPVLAIVLEAVKPEPAHRPDADRLASHGRAPRARVRTCGAAASDGHVAMSPTQRRIYLDLLKKALTRYPLSLREQWLILWLAGVEAGLIREIVRWAATGRFAAGGSAWFNPYVRALGMDFPIEADTMIGLSRLNNIEHCVADVLRRGVPGDLAETGVWRGGATIFMRGLLRAYGDTTRSVWVADSFEGLPKPDVASYPADAGNDLRAFPGLAVGLDDVRRNFERYGLLDDQVRFVPGWFRDTLPTAPIDRLAVLRLDGDLYESTIVALRALHGKVQPGGFVIVDDYGAVPACRQAVDDFRAEAGVTVPLRPIDWTGVYWQVAGAAVASASSPGPTLDASFARPFPRRSRTVVIDSERRTLTHGGPGLPVTLPLYSRAAFREISRHWVRVGWSLHHYAGFSWMGQPVLQLPEDLVRLQEAVFEVQPDLIVETGVAYGGSLLYLATLCRALGKGRVIGIDVRIRPDVRAALEGHVLAPHITLIEGDSTSSEVLRQVRDVHHPPETVMVVLDSAHDRAHVRAELESYAPLVNPGSYLVAEDGIMNDLFDVPGGAWGWALDNPTTAVVSFLADHPEFRLCRPPGTDHGTVSVSYWTGGWLRRVA